MNELKTIIQNLLNKEITQFSLKGKGAVNNAYYIETSDGKKYIVKQERTDKEVQPQNDLVTEARVTKMLCELNLSIPIPNIIFISEVPKMYCYEFIEGNPMKELWINLTEAERVDICCKLGYFHAEIGKKFTKEMAEKVGIKIDMSPDLHPEVLAEYNRLILDEAVPEEFVKLVKLAKSIFERTQSRLVFQFLHNDAHHENVIIRDKIISGFIDLGMSEYGEIAKEFSRYIRDYPGYFQHIVSAYEKESGSVLSYGRLVSNALISGFIDIVKDYSKGGESKVSAEKAIRTYGRLMKDMAVTENGSVL